MIAHFVGGWTQNINDGAPFWGLAESDLPGAVDASHDALQNALEGRGGAFMPGRGVQVIRHTCGEDLTVWMRPGLFVGHKRLWVCYSYGNADMFKALRSLLMARADAPLIDRAELIVPVPRWANGQSGPWKLPTLDVVPMATVYQVDTFPESFPLANPGPGRVNIDCNYFPDKTRTTHETVQYHPAVVAGVDRAMRELYAQEANHG